MLPDIKKHNKPSPEELSRLIRFNFPKLEESDVASAAEKLTEISRTGFNRSGLEIGLEIILNPGSPVKKQAKRVQAAYIRNAPAVCELTTEQDFRRWLLLASKISELSFTCIEGFFESSTVIIRKGGLSLLEKWAELGISLARKNNKLAIAYFNFTAYAVTSPYISEGSSRYLSSDPGDLSTNCSANLSGDLSTISSNKLSSNPSNPSTDTSADLSTDLFSNSSRDISFDLSTNLYSNLSTVSTNLSSNPSTNTVIDFEKFGELVSIGEMFSSSNIRVAEAYFKYLPDMLSLLSPDKLRILCNIIEYLSSIQWTIAVDILAETKNILSAIEPHRQKEFLISLSEFIEHSGLEARAAPALFKNTPQVMAKLNDSDFRVWVSIAREVAKINTDAAIIFLNRSPNTLAFLKVSELKEWSDKAVLNLSLNFSNLSNLSLKPSNSSNLSSEKQPFEKFYISSFNGLGKHLKNTSNEEREHLLDIGIELALVDPECIDNYFEYSPVALRLLSDVKFKEWVEIGFRLSEESSSFGSIYFKNSVISFRKVTPSYQEEIFKIARLLLEENWLLAGKFFEILPVAVEKIEQRDLRKWADIGIKVYKVDRNLAVDYLTYSPVLLKDLDVTELEEWAENGLKVFEGNYFLGRPYFSLKSRSSKDVIDELAGSAALKKIAGILRYYAVGLSGENFKIRSKKELPIYNEKGPINPVVSGRTIYLEPRIKKYGSFEENFKIYKLSVMHEIGHNQFGSSRFSSEALHKLISKIDEIYGSGGTDESVAGSRLSGNQIFLGNRNFPEEKPLLEDQIILEDRVFQENKTPAENQIDISAVIALFPARNLAANIFGVLEDARVEYLIMKFYKGVRSDLENIRYQMLLARPVPKGDLEKLMEALLWLSTHHEPTFELTEKSKPLLDKIRNSLQEHIFQPDSSTLRSLELTFYIYKIFEDSLGPLKHWNYEMLKNIEYRGVGLFSLVTGESLNQDSEKHMISSYVPEGEEKPTVEKEPPEEKKPEKKPKYAKDKNWKVLGRYSYDEWDYVMKDYKSDWCVVHEVEPTGGSNDYYIDASRRYRNEIALIKGIFSRMKPESFHKLKGQTDGTEIDVDAFSEALIEKRCGVNPDEKFYVRWDKRKRDVATLFLVDVSFSTRKILNGDRRSILDIERDALVIMIQALESIGDKYAVYAFSGYTREDLEYYIIKEFDEKMSGDVEQRISQLEPVANTRLGPAIRHSIKKLGQINAGTKILILLSDGEPYDTCFGEGAYQGKIAEEDTKIAIQEGNSQGIHFFCITVDTNPGDYLDTIFSDTGYTIIDDAQVLPERLPLLYKRISS